MFKSRWFALILLGPFSFFLLQCATPNYPANPPLDKKSPTPTLTLIEAKMRAQQIAQIDYEIEFDLSQGADRYNGREVIHFVALTTGRDLRLDFAGGTVTRLALNNKPLEVQKNNDYLVIPGQEIHKGPQQLEIDFNQEYSRQGRGLTRFIDPLDKQTYLYTDFEPYDANRAFPCFDQPDLKATYTLKVLAPKNWEVISSARESTVQNDPSGFKSWIFPRSERFSTYVFSLHAGPYAKWEDKKFRIPLRLFARQSLAAHVHPEEWFPITRHGFDFFEKYFSTPYPYKKYDQLMVPEFNAGAMENVAAVTFTERFAARGRKTRNQTRALSITILHEMAHMWFGDLVTTRWWGDLWLNESFATYMSSVAMAASPEYPEAWHQFFSGKTGAYYEDQMVTTHPIVATVNDTNEAFTAFDSITYGKGAAVLKQLAYNLGEDNFRKGLKIYFERFAGQNAEYRDFMNAMSEASDKDLDHWRRQWFETAGVNGISAQFDCRDGRISQFAIIQTAPSGASVMRPHSFEVALLSRSNGVVRVNDILRVEISEPTTYVPAAIGKACPHVVYPNLNDHGYLKVRLDDQSVNNLKYSLNEIQDELLRHQLWYALWDQVRDAQFSFVTFADLLVPEALAKETNDVILRFLTATASASIVYYQQTPSLKNKELAAFSERLDQQMWQRLQAAKPTSNDQLVWFEAISSTPSSPWGRDQMKQVLTGKKNILGLRLDQDRRWSLINHLSKYSDPESLALIEREAKKDTSSEGFEQKIGSLAARPVWEEKLKWIDEYKLTKSNYSFSQLRAAMRNLFPINQNELRDRFSEQFFKDLAVINKTKDNFIVGMFTGLAPYECSHETDGKIKSFLTQNDQLQPVISKNLKIKAQEGERCRNIVAYAEKNISAPPSAPSQPN